MYFDSSCYSGAHTAHSFEVKQTLCRAIFLASSNLNSKFPSTSKALAKYLRVRPFGVFFVIFSYPTFVEDTIKHV